MYTPMIAQDCGEGLWELGYGDRPSRDYLSCLKLRQMEIERLAMPRGLRLWNSIIGWGLLKIGSRRTTLKIAICLFMELSFGTRLFGDRSNFWQWSSANWTSATEVNLEIALGDRQRSSNSRIWFLGEVGRDLRTSDIELGHPMRVGDWLWEVGLRACHSSWELSYLETNHPRPLCYGARWIGDRLRSQLLKIAWGVRHWPQPHGDRHWETNKGAWIRNINYFSYERSTIFR